MWVGDQSIQAQTVRCVDYQQVYSDNGNQAGKVPQSLSEGRRKEGMIETKCNNKDSQK